MKWNKSKKSKPELERWDNRNNPILFASVLSDFHANVSASYLFEWLRKHSIRLSYMYISLRPYIPAPLVPKSSLPTFNRLNFKPTPFSWSLQPSSSPFGSYSLFHFLSPLCPVPQDWDRALRVPLNRRPSLFLLSKKRRVSIAPYTLKKMLYWFQRHLRFSSPVHQSCILSLHSPPRSFRRYVPVECNGERGKILLTSFFLPLCLQEQARSVRDGRKEPLRKRWCLLTKRIR